MTGREFDSLPSTWTRAAIGDLTEGKVGQEGPQRDTAFTYVDISSIDRATKRITDPKELPVRDAPNRARQRLKAGDVLVSMTRPNLNAVALLPASLDGSIGSTGFDVLRTSKIDPRWLFYFVQTTPFIEAMSARVQGALYPAVRPKDIRSYSIPVAPLPEQHRIIEVIEGSFTRIDAAVRALKRVRMNLSRYMASVVKVACEDSRTKFPSRAGSLASFSETITKGATPTSYGHSFTETGPLFVKVESLDGKVIRHDWCAHISLQTNAFLLRSQLRSGDLLYSIAGTLGRTAIVRPEDLPANTNQAVAIIRPKPGLEPQYLRIVMNGPGIRTAKDQNKRGVGLSNLNLEQLRQIPLRVPPIQIQREIVVEVEKQTSFAEEVARETEVGLKRCDRLRQAILRMAFEGRLVRQDSNDDPASALLERFTSKRTETPRTASRWGRTASMG
ncbi:MAG: restriction endonuclease subunit S [Thermoplasmata archaeon]|jgi:type I restriction enzyme S subunit